MKKSVLLLILVIFLVIPVAFSATNYNETGNFDTDYQLGTSIFNSQLNPATDVTVTSRIVTNPRGIPLVTDLDGDGTNEIIVFDLPLVKLYHDSNSSCEIYPIPVSGSIKDWALSFDTDMTYS